MVADKRIVADIDFVVRIERRGRLVRRTVVDEQVAAHDQRIAVRRCEQTADRMAEAVARRAVVTKDVALDQNPSTVDRVRVADLESTRAGFECAACLAVLEGESTDLDVAVGY